MSECHDSRTPMWFRKGRDAESTLRAPRLGGWHMGTYHQWAYVVT